MSGAPGSDDSHPVEAGNDRAPGDAGVGLRRELRIAPVMTGGTSLAVWMGGVTAELHRLTGASSSSNEPVDKIYGRLLDLTETDVVVDVITGTSAGGLNGALLGAALSQGVSSRDFMKLRDLWLDLGDISRLLRSPNESDPPSLLKGDDYFRPELHRLLQQWQGPCGESSDDRGKTEVDLVITVTTLTGEPAHVVDDLGTTLSEKSHAQTLRFRPEHFCKAEWPLQLATAGRASASIPGVFEPCLLRVGSSTRGEPDFKGIASFSESRWAVDGGVTVNLPLGEALDRVFARGASRPVRRVVLYVRPTPGLIADATPDPDAMPSILSAVTSVFTAPRVEGIHGDVRLVQEHNRRAKRQELLRVATVTTPAKMQAMAADLWPVYRRLRAYSSVLQMLDRVASDTQGNVRVRHRGLETELATARGAWLSSGVVALSGRADGRWGWGIAPIRYGASVCLRLLGDALLVAPDLDAASRTKIQNARAEISRCIARLDAIRGLDAAYWEERVAEIAKGLGPGSGPTALAGLAEGAYGDWPNLSSVEARAVWIERIWLKGEDSPGSGEDLTTPILDELEAVAFAVAEQLCTARPALISSLSGDANGLVSSQQDAALGVTTLLLAAPDGDLEGEVPACAEVLKRLLMMHVVDLTLAGGDLRDPQIVELIQVSWDSPSPLDPSRRPEDKLTGTELARLGAFLKPAWRANDWLWGRLDGSYRLIQVLLDPVRLLALGVTPEMVIRALPDVGALSRDERKSINDELAFLESATTAVPLRLDACAEVIGREVHKHICAEELPVVAAHIRRSSALGGLEADGGVFRRAVENASSNESGLAGLAPRLLRLLSVGSESAASEARGDLLPPVASHAAAVALGALGGEHVGSPSVRSLARPLRSTARYVHAFVRALTTQSQLGRALTLFGLIVSACFIALAAGGQEVNPAITSLSIIVFTVGFAVTALRGGVWSVAPSALLVIVAGLAIVGDGVEGVITSEDRQQVTQTLATDSLIQLREGTVVIKAPPLFPAVHIPVDESAEVHFQKSDAELVRPGTTRSPAWKTKGFTEGVNGWPPIAVMLTVAIMALWGMSLAFRLLISIRAGHRHRRPSAVALATAIVFAPLTMFNADWFFDRLLTGPKEGVRGWVVDVAAWLHGNNLTIVLLCLAGAGLLIGLGVDRTFVRWTRGHRVRLMRRLRGSAP